MATFISEPRSYEQAEEVFRGKRSGSGVIRLGYQTMLERVPCDAALTTEPIRDYRITLFGNEVVRFHQDGTKVYKTCGWITASTIDRLDAFTPGRYRIGGKNYTRRAKSGTNPMMLARDLETGILYEFTSRLIMNENNSVTGVV
jgi:hypothetical protein